MALCLKPLENGDSIPLDKAIIFIGRHPDCDVVVTHSRKISRKHCCIALVNDQLVIRDLGSTNGVRVNGEKIEGVQKLKRKDEVAIGDVFYQLVTVETPDAGKVTHKEQPPEVQSEEQQQDVAQAKPPIPLDLSQDMPVMVPDEPESFQPEKCFPSLNSEVDDDGDEEIVPLLVGDESGEVFPEMISESNEFDSRDSQIEFLSE
jgi:predicted component of type VI protein secretion system